MPSDFDRPSDHRRDSRNSRDRDHRGGGGGGGGRDGGQRRGVPLTELDPALTAVSHKLIGCARDVHMSLGPGFDRAVYLHALCDELRAQGVTFKQDHAFDVKYKGQSVGKTIPDLYIADRFLVMVLARYAEIGSAERTILRAQLRAADLELGLIVNFAGRLLKDGLVRVLNPDKIQSLRGSAGAPGADPSDNHDDHFDVPPSA